MAVLVSYHQETLRIPEGVVMSNVSTEAYTDSHGLTNRYAPTDAWTEHRKSYSAVAEKKNDESDPSCRLIESR